MTITYNHRNIFTNNRSNYSNFLGVIMNTTTIQTFESVCNAIKKQLLTSNKFIPGKFRNPTSYKDNYMWISTSNNKIGFEQCHYEIRLCEDLNSTSYTEFISVEIHIESSKKNISNSLDSDLSILPMKKESPNHYIWRGQNKQFPVNILQVQNIIDELIHLDNTYGSTIRNNIKKTFG